MRDLLILLIGVVLVFFPVCGHEFVSWDDFQIIVNNPHLAQPTAASLREIWREPDPGLYIPLVYTLWWMLALAVGTPDVNGILTLNPGVFHSANLLVHLAASMLAYRLLRALANRFSSGSSLPALLGALLFALHPVQVEAVAWATGMRDLLGGALSLLALLQVVRGRWIFAAFAMLLAVLSKPSAVMVLPMALAIQWLWAGEPLSSAVRRSTWMIVVAAIGVGLTFWHQPQIRPDISLPWHRPLIALDAIAFYLGKLVAPVGLTFDYARRPEVILANGQIWWTWIIPVLAMAILAVRRRRELWLMALLFAFPIVPVLGLTPFTFQAISTTADHYLYLSMLGPAVGVMILCGNARVGRWVVGLLLAGLAFMAHLQVHRWHDNETLFTYATAVNPHSAPAWNGLAATMLTKGDIPAADEATRRALLANPNYAYARLMRVYIKILQRDKPAAEQEWSKFMEIYKLQSNFDMVLAERVKRELDQMQRE